MSLEFLTTPSAQRAVLRSEADIGLAFGKIEVDQFLAARRIAPLGWCTFAAPHQAFAREPSLEVWSGQPHILVRGSDHSKGPIEKMLEGRGITRHIIAHAPNFLTALLLTEQAGALFTTLRQPYEDTAHKLGLMAFETPLDLPSVPPTLLTRPDPGYGFEAWLTRLCRSALPSPG